MREAFPGFYRPTDDEFGRLWDEGTFVFDTNVLLNLYRYSGSTRGQLLGVLGALSERLFLPHQVGREFLDNRLRTIQKQRQGFGGLREAAEGAAEAADSGLRSVLRLRPKEDLPRGLRDALEGVRKGYEELIERLGELERGVPRASNSPEDDEVWAAIDGLFEGKVGPPYGEEEAKEAEEEAARRKNAKLPPGFKDDGPGDYLVWRQTVDEAKRSGRPVVLVTDDRKEDWWWIGHGETLGPRRFLVEEMRREAGVPFYMYKPDRLMEHARDRLGLEVTDEAIDEAKGLRAEEAAGIHPGEGSFAMLERAFFSSLRFLDTDEETVARHYYLGQETVEEIAAKQGTEKAEVSRLLSAASKKLGLDPDEFSPAAGAKALFRSEPTPRKNVLTFLRNRGPHRSTASWDEKGEDFGDGGDWEPRGVGPLDRFTNDLALRLLLRSLPPEHLQRTLLESLRNPDQEPGS